MCYLVMCWSSISRSHVLGIALALSMAMNAEGQTGLAQGGSSPPVLEIATASVTPAQAFGGDILRIDATIKNTGGPSGPFALVLWVERGELGRQNGDLTADADRRFTFQALAPNKVGQTCFELGLQSQRGSTATLKPPRLACVTIKTKLARGGGATTEAPGSSDPTRMAPPGPRAADASPGHGLIALKLDDIGTKQDLKQSVRALSDDARIQLTDGRVVTKRDLMSQMQRKNQQHVAAAGRPGDGGAAFAAAKSKVEAQRAAMLADLHLRIAAEMKRLRDEGPQIPFEFEAIRAEARRLKQEYANAPPWEKAQIEARAAALMTQAKQFLKE